MKRNLVILTLIGLLLVPTILLAQGTIKVEVPGEAPFETLDELVEIIAEVGRWIYAIVFALAVIFILVSAFQFLTAGGNPEKLISARQMLIYALVAVAVAVIAWGLPALIKLLLK